LQIRNAFKKDPPGELPLRRIFVFFRPEIGGINAAPGKIIISDRGKDGVGHTASGSAGSPARLSGKEAPRGTSR